MCGSRDVAFAVEAVVPVEAFEIVCGSSALGAQHSNTRLLGLLERGLRQELDNELELIIKLICELDLEAHGVRGVEL